MKTRIALILITLICAALTLICATAWASPPTGGGTIYYVHTGLRTGFPAVHL
jgi:hypothetical protein